MAADNWVQLTPESFKSHDGVEELNRMLKLLFDAVAGDGQSLKVYSGYGAPTIAADNGSLYLRQDGAASTTLYVRHSGTTWTAK